MSKQNSLVTLTTDFGLQDEYVAVMKGVILNTCQNARIVDLCHNINPQDIFGAAYILFSAYSFFPSGTMHVVVVDPGVGSTRRIVCLKTDKYTFLAPDNGVLSLIADGEKSLSIINVTNNKYFLPEVSNTFHGRDVFAPVAGHLMNGVDINELGAEIFEIEKIETPAPVLSTNGIATAQIIYIDRFGNLITNINRGLLKSFQIDGMYGALSITVANHRIKKINQSYSEVEEGGLVALFGSAGYLEIAVNKANAKELLNVEKGDTVTINCSKYIFNEGID